MSISHSQAFVKYFFNLFKFFSLNQFRSASFVASLSRGALLVYQILHRLSTLFFLFFRLFSLSPFCTNLWPLFAPVLGFFVYIICTTAYICPYTADSGRSSFEKRSCTKINCRIDPYRIYCFRNIIAYRNLFHKDKSTMILLLLMMQFLPLNCAKHNITRRKPNITAQQYNLPQANITKKNDLSKQVVFSGRTEWFGCTYKNKLCVSKATLTSSLFTITYYFPKIDTSF